MLRVEGADPENPFETAVVGRGRSRTATRKVLVDERLHALARVRDLAAARHQLRRVRVGLGLLHVDVRVEALLAEPLRLAGAAGRPVEQLARRALQVGRRHHPVDEAPVGGGPRVDRIAGERHLQRALAADRPADRDGRRVAEPPALAAGQRERRAVRRDREVAGRDQLTAGRGRQPVHACDHHLRHRLDRLHQRRARPQQRAHVAQPRADHVGEVVAGAEHRSGARDDHAPRVAAADLAERVGHLLHRLARQRVAPIGAIHGQDRVRSLALDADVPVAHGRPPRSMSARIVGAGAAGRRHARRPAERGRAGDAPFGTAAVSP